MADSPETPDTPTEAARTEAPTEAAPTEEAAPVAAAVTEASQSETEAGDEPRYPDLYDGLFLMSSAAGSDLGGSLEHIQEILDRAEAQVEVLRKWDERRLAYPINGQKRGLFIHALFRVKRSRLQGIERDCNLSERVIRQMVIRGDYIGETEMDLAKQEASKTRDEVAMRREAEAEAKAKAEAKAAAEAKAEAEAAAAVEAAAPEAEAPEAAETQEAPAEQA